MKTMVRVNYLNVNFVTSVEPIADHLLLHVRAIKLEIPWLREYPAFSW